MKSAALAAAVGLLVAVRAEAGGRAIAVYVTSGGAAAPPSSSAGLEPKRAFDRAAAAEGLAAPAVIELVGVPPARAGAQLADAQRALSELRFEEAVTLLDAAIAEAALSGGAGLSAAELDDLYLLRGVAALRLGDGARPRAWEDFTRAALLAPERVLDAGRFSPAVVDSWKRAIAEAGRRPRGVLVVRAPVGARVSVDARPAVAAPAVVSGLLYGEHFVRVEEGGHVPWASAAVLTSPTLELEVPPRAVLALDDRAAAEMGRRAGAPVVLIATPMGMAADGDQLLEISSVRAADARRTERALVRSGDAGAVARTVRGLLAAAAASELRAQPAAAPAPPPRRWWPVVVAAAVVVGTAVLAGLAVSGDKNGTGFSVTGDPGNLGR